MVDGGYDCIDRSTYAGTGYCTMLKGSPITKTGILSSWCVYWASSTTRTVRLRIYRPTGSQYLYVGGSSGNCPQGYSSHSANINVQSGDIVGFYTPDGGSFDADMDAGGNSYDYKTYETDVTYDTPQSDWNYGDAHVRSLGVTVTVVYNDYYVRTTGNDSLSGDSWTNAWKTINKAATTVTDGKTVHIGFGTYSNEPANNKIAPQNVGTSGIYYKMETAGGSGGTGSVIIEKN